MRGAGHLWCDPVVVAAELQFDTFTPNFLIQESIERMDGFHNELMTEPFLWEDSDLIPPDRPGLGFGVNEEVLKAHCVAFRVGPENR